MNKWLSNEEIDVALCDGLISASEMKVRRIAWQAQEANRLRERLQQIESELDSNLQMPVYMRNTPRILERIRELLEDNDRSLKEGG